MTDAAHPLPDIDEADAEAVALKAAIAKSRADPREVPHEEMREWLLKIADGDFDATPPVPRLVRYISEENPIAARQMGRELLLAGDSLAVFPRRGRRGVDPTTRELVTVRPYVIVYQLDEAGNATILNVWHSAQDRP
jgi:toxin ParE1/3/4